MLCPKVAYIANNMGPDHTALKGTANSDQTDLKGTGLGLPLSETPKTDFVALMPIQIKSKYSNCISKSGILLSE